MLMNERSIFISASNLCFMKGLSKNLTTCIAGSAERVECQARLIEPWSGIRHSTWVWSAV